jgi:hypothetical protein
MSPNFGDSEEGMSMGRRGSGKKKCQGGLLDLARKTHVWSERNRGDGGCIHRGWALLVWIQSVWTQYLRLCLPLATVSRIKERQDGKNRERDNCTDNTCRVCRIRSSSIRSQSSGAYRRQWPRRSVQFSYYCWHQMWDSPDQSSS